jgi:hypothetical protein
LFLNQTPTSSRTLQVTPLQTQLQVERVRAEAAEAAVAEERSMREDKEGANGVLAKMLYELQKCAAQRDRDVAERERAVSERERKINVAVTTSEQELLDAESRMATRMREVEELLRSQLAAEQATKLKLQEEVDEARGQATKAQREKAAAELKAGKLEQELKATRAPFVHRKRSQVLEQPSADEHSPNLEPLPSSVMNPSRSSITLSLPKPRDGDLVRSPQLLTQCPLALSPSHSLTLSCIESLWPVWHLWRSVRAS